MTGLPSRPTSLKRKRRLYIPVTLTLHDLAAIAAGLLLAYWIRFASGWIAVVEGYEPSDYARLLPIAMLVWVVSLSFSHLYRRDEKIWSWRVARRLARASLLSVALIATVLFFAHGLTRHPPARWMVPLMLVTVPGLIGTGRWFLHRRLIVSARLSGRGLARALVVGVGPTAKEVARCVRRHPEFGWNIVGFLSADDEDVGRVLTGIEVVGTVGALREVLKRERVEAVFVAQPDFRHEMLAGVFFECQKRMVDVKVVPDLAEMLFSQVSIEEVDGIPFLGLRDTPLEGWNAVLKRTFDLVVSGAFLALSSPFMLLIAWLVRNDSLGPVFFRQERIGTDGRRFTILKFRTMYVDAERGTGPVFSTPDDPRQTRIGRRLRQTHLDELPQLLNVLRGDMSLVGPRPERPHFVEQFSEEVPLYMARHRIKSGMTGWAQVNGQTGYEGTISERLKYDLYYIENWSPLFDLKVLALTLVWLARRIRQMRTLPSDHPSLRRPPAAEEIPETGGSAPARTGPAMQQTAPQNGK
ncbi:sugar transferase [Candidatus Sumerlaeota bacterium]|nr:sugar transferase [Candidatus Sumerlaeota bacterium]